MTKTVSKFDLSKIKGSLMGGAVGDAIGYHVEFLKYTEIEKKYGYGGIFDMSENSRVSDDTQMTLFTAEGILHAITRGMNREICNIPGAVYLSYLRWYYTQTKKIVNCGNMMEIIVQGELIKNEKLYRREAPGNTCLTVLSSGEMGTIEKPINNSKGCGGVMRVAPCGLHFRIDNPFNIACECAAITHGHPTGYLAAGAFAQIINDICNDYSLIDAINHSIEILEEKENSKETVTAIQKAVELSKEKPSQINLSKLGEGWIAEEALAIALYSVLCYPDDFRKAILLSINHDGDSDSTGSICGNIMGAMLGYEAIPQEWIDRINLKDTVLEIAQDLHTQYEDEEFWLKKYC